MGSREQLKIDVLLLLFQQPAGLPVVGLPYEFLRFHHRPLDLQAHGYPSLGALLNDMSSMVELSSSRPGDPTSTLRILLRLPGQADQPSWPRAPAPVSWRPRPLLLAAPLIQGWPRFAHWVPVQPDSQARSTRRPGAAAPVKSLVKQQEGTGQPAPVVPSKEADPLANGERGQPMTYSEVLRSGGGCRPKVGPGLRAHRAGDPAAQSQDRRAKAGQKTSPTGFWLNCPVRKWLLSVLKTPGYRDGLHTRKLASLCLRQRHQELSDFLSENRYGSLSELLARVPEVEEVPGCALHSDSVIRLRASTRLDGAAQPGGGPSLTENGPSALLSRDEPDPSAPSPEVSGNVLERVSLLLAEHPSGLSTFQLRQAYREAYQQGLAVEGHPSLRVLLGARGGAVSVRGLGVQARLFPRPPPGCRTPAAPETSPFRRAGDWNGQLPAGLPEVTITETGFHASTG